MIDLLWIRLSYEIKKASLGHELSQQVVWLVPTANTNQLNQMRVLQLFHNFHLFHKIVRQLVIFPQSLDCYRQIEGIDNSFIHIAILTTTNTMLFRISEVEKLTGSR